MLQEDIKSIQADWQHIQDEGEAFVDAFYTQLFELDPDLKCLFKRSMRMQGRKVMSMFDSAISRLDRPLTLVGPLLSAGQRHSHYGVEARHYQTMGEAFINTLAGYVEDWSEHKREIWREAFSVMESIMAESVRAYEGADKAHMNQRDQGN